MAERLTCANHPKVATNLGCSKCGKPICTSCVIETPVGLRCRECARLRRIPTYAVSPVQYLVASASALGTALVTGIGWALVQSVAFVGFFSFFIALGVGYIVGEIVSVSVNRKRGLGLQVIAGSAVLLSYLVSRTPFLALLARPSLAAAAILGSFLNPIGLVILALAIYIAASRIR